MPTWKTVSVICFDTSVLVDYLRVEELLDAGDVIGVADTMIAGTAHDATLVTAADHFERVPDLSVRLIERES